MRTLCSTCYLVFFTLSISFAQETDSLDNGSYSIGNEIEFEIDLSGETDTTRNLTTRWITFGIGVNPVTENGNSSLPNTSQFYDDWDLRIGKSTNIDLGIVQQKLNLVNHRLNLRYGVGLDINKYFFDDAFKIDPDSNTWQTTDLSANVKKNRLTTTYLQVPLMLNYESSNKHYESFRLNIGGFAGLRISSNQKIKFNDKDDNPFEDKIKHKERDNFEMNNLTYGLLAQVGYGPVNLYGKYHLQNVFEDDFAQDLNTLSLGIMIVPF